MKSPGLLAEAGLRNIKANATTKIFRAGEPYQTLMLDRAEQCREALVAHNLISHDELDARLAELAAHLAHPRTVVLHGTMIQASGQKP